MSNRNTPLQRAWLKALLFCLFCYATFGKTFAYLFVGELVLVVGIIIFLLRPRFGLLLSDRILTLWGIFAFWGLCRTLPFLTTYRFLAIRDAVLWGYGIFAVLIVCFVNESLQISRALNAYRTFLRWYLPVIPFLLAIAIFFKGGLPSLPWASDITILSLKAPDAGVHLGAAGLFLLLFPGVRGKDNTLTLFNLTTFIGWALCAVEIVVVSRGGFIAMMIPIFLVSLLKPSVVGWKVVGLGLMVVVLSIVVLESDLITAKVHGRTLNAETVQKNLGSLVGSGTGGGDQEDNKAWRLSWWRRIIRYTVYGPYFWTGKGYGVNLALSDGPPGIPTAEAKLRSPHNGTMTVLARTGVPGLCIWILLNVLFALQLWKGYTRARSRNQLFWSRLDLWLLCYWLALLINSSFDVYLEGPQGGIWYWSIIGFGVAALRIQRRENLPGRSRATNSARAVESLESQAVLV